MKVAFVLLALVAFVGLLQSADAFSGHPCYTGEPRETFGVNFPFRHCSQCPHGVDPPPRPFVRSGSEKWLTCQTCSTAKCGEYIYGDNVNLKLYENCLRKWCFGYGLPEKLRSFREAYNHRETLEETEDEQGSFHDEFVESRRLNQRGRKECYTASDCPTSYDPRCERWCIPPIPNKYISYCGFRALQPDDYFFCLP